MNGICRALIELSDDEGVESAISVTEKWRNTLEAMAEAANEDQQKAIRLLFGPLDMALDLLLEARKSVKT